MHAWAVRRALSRAARTFPSAPCLPQALAAEWLLRAQGVAAVLRIGVAPAAGDGRPIDAHAWVEVHLPNSGWVTMDPTPAVSETVGDSQWFAVSRVIDTLRLRALYFTRARAPWGEGPLYRHIGLYAFRRAALEQFIALPPSPLEQRERLEQLRALEAGMRIDAALLDKAAPSVDTGRDLAAATAAAVAQDHS